MPHSYTPEDKSKLENSIRNKVKRKDLNFDFTPQVGMYLSLLDFSKEFNFSEQEIEAMKATIFTIRDINIRKRHLEVHL